MECLLMNIENKELLRSKYKNMEHLCFIKQYIQLLVILIFCCHILSIFI